MSREERIRLLRVEISASRPEQKPIEQAVVSFYVGIACTGHLGASLHFKEDGGNSKGYTGTYCFDCSKNPCLIAKYSCYLPDNHTFPETEEDVGLLDNLIKRIVEEKYPFFFCFMGRNRTGTILVALLMIREKLSFEQAYDKARGIREYIDLKEGMREYLIQLETRLNDGSF